MSRRIHIVLSAPGLFGFMSGQPERLRQAGFETTVISAPSAWLDERAHAEGADRMQVPICRDISPWRDAVTLVRLCQILRRENPDAVLLSGPKAIFLGGMAAWFCDIPTRVVVYHGMRQENLRGALRGVLDLCDRIAFGSATAVLAVSPSLRDLVIRRRLVAAAKIALIGHGTANGVDVRRFSLTPGAVSDAGERRRELGIPPGAPVVGFVGRLTEDKGLGDAYAACLALRRRFPGLHLLLVGDDEMRTASGRDLLADMRREAWIRWVSHTDAVEQYLHLAWVQVFPSAREGFGMVIAEAAALAIPTVGYAVTGVRDAIADGQTGLLVEPGDVAGLAAALAQYLGDADLRRRHGLAGWSRVRQLYTSGETWPSYLTALGCPVGAASIRGLQSPSAPELVAYEQRERTLR